MKNNTNIRYGQLPPKGSNRAVTTGEFRPPVEGEWYASGAIVEAYQAPSNLVSSYWICVPVIDKPERRAPDLASKLGEQQPTANKKEEEYDAR